MPDTGHGVRDLLRCLVCCLAVLGQTILPPSSEQGRYLFSRGSTIMMYVEIYISCLLIFQNRWTRAEPAHRLPDPGGPVSIPERRLADPG